MARGGRGGYRGRGGGGFFAGGNFPRKSTFVKSLTSLRPTVGYLRDDACEIVDDESMKELYEHGFFGKGTVSRRQPNRAMLLPEELMTHIISHAGAPGASGGMSAAAAAAVASGLVQGTQSTRRPRAQDQDALAASRAAGAGRSAAAAGEAGAVTSSTADDVQMSDVAQKNDAGDMKTELLAQGEAVPASNDGGAASSSPRAAYNDYLTLICGDFEEHITRASLPNAFYAAAAASCHGHDALSFEAARQVVHYVSCPPPRLRHMTEAIGDDADASVKQIAKRLDKLTGKRRKKGSAAGIIGGEKHHGPSPADLAAKAAAEALAKEKAASLNAERAKAKEALKSKLYISNSLVLESASAEIVDSSFNADSAQPVSATSAPVIDAAVDSGALTQVLESPHASGAVFAANSTCVDSVMTEKAEDVRADGAEAAPGVEGPKASADAEGSTVSAAKLSCTDAAASASAGQAALKKSARAEKRGKRARTEDSGGPESHGGKVLRVSEANPASEGAAGATESVDASSAPVVSLSAAAADEKVKDGDAAAVPRASRVPKVRMRHVVFETSILEPEATIYAVARSEGRFSVYQHGAHTSPEQLALEEKWAYEASQAREAALAAGITDASAIAALIPPPPAPPAPLTIQELWAHFCSRVRNFPARYAVYSHCRDRGYVVRDGHAFGADFVLYKNGPGFGHASHCITVQPLRVVHADLPDVPISAPPVIVPAPSSEPAFYIDEEGVKQPIQSGEACGDPAPSEEVMCEAPMMMPSPEPLAHVPTPVLAAEPDFLPVLGTWMDIHGHGRVIGNVKKLLLSAHVTLVLPTAAAAAGSGGGVDVPPGLEEHYFNAAAGKVLSNPACARALAASVRFTHMTRWLLNLEHNRKVASLLGRVAAIEAATSWNLDMDLTSAAANVVRVTAENTARTAANTVLSMAKKTAREANAAAKKAARQARKEKRRADREARLAAAGDDAAAVAAIKADEDDEDNEDEEEEDNEDDDEGDDDDVDAEANEAVVASEGGEAGEQQPRGDNNDAVSNESVAAAASAEAPQSAETVDALIPLARRERPKRARNAASSSVPVDSANVANPLPTLSKQQRKQEMMKLLSSSVLADSSAAHAASTARPAVVEVAIFSAAYDPADPKASGVDALLERVSASIERQAAATGKAATEAVAAEAASGLATAADSVLAGAIAEDTGIMDREQWRTYDDFEDEEGREADSNSCVPSAAFESFLASTRNALAEDVRARAGPSSVPLRRSGWFSDRKTWVTEVVTYDH